MERLWSWEAKVKQISENLKAGDRVNVGYISDCEPHNYQEATVVWVNWYWFYPGGTLEKKERRAQVKVRFDDGVESFW